MRLLFKEYPEILFCDATYKTNENRMALMVFMIVDGNGESGLVGLCFIKSESEKCTLSALESLKEASPSHNRIRVIMADKDMANRNAFKKAFPSAEMSICIFHTIQSFTREITCSKRNLTPEKRDEAIKILKQMVYADCSQTYKILYEKLGSLESPELMQYFNDNWHDKIEQWTLYGQCASAPFMNRTNNKLERFNRELHDTVKKYSNIADAFHNLMIACKAHRSERHLRAMSMVYKIQNSLEDPVEQDYRNILTKFAADKVMEQILVSERLLDRITIGQETRMRIGNQELVIDESMCQCNFFTGMRLPCRHIFTLLRKKEDDLYLPELCDRRWYLEKFENFKKREAELSKDTLHVKNNGSEVIPVVSDRDQTRIINLTEAQKFREIRELALGLAEICSTQSDEVYEIVRAKIENFSTTIVEYINKLHGKTTIKLNITLDQGDGKNQPIPSNDDENRSNMNSSVIEEVQNDLDFHHAPDCICKFDDTDNNLSKMSCCHCQRMVHNVCYGILDAFSDDYNSKLDPYLKFSCQRCPQEKYSDKSLLKLQPHEIERKILIRAALKSIVKKCIIFPRESNLIEPVVDFLKRRTWDKLLPIFFQQIDEDPDATEACSFRYDLPDDSINIEISGHGHIIDYDDNQPFDLEELYNFLQLNPGKTALSSNSQVPIQSKISIAAENDDHQYLSQIRQLELPPVLVNVRSGKGKSSSRRKTRLKIFAALRTIEKRKRMTVWLFGEPGSKPIINGSTKISCDDLKKISSITWQKFRNEIVDRSILVCLFEDDAWIEFDKKLTEMNRKKNVGCVGIVKNHSVNQEAFHVIDVWIGFTLPVWDCSQFRGKKYGCALIALMKIDF
ncbi:uncharacterized protein LOC141856032 [Brevipalpus obovatus]|uniref:uncharacterized protein LOC141856032 n=1 Tax=Brevipalpus obovatus TaxID=246614 RepID=UPI003D9E9E8B